MKQEELKRYNDNLSNYQETLETLEKLEKNLNEWNKKTVNISFNKKYYTYHNGYRDVYLYTLSKPRYTFSSHELEMYITRSLTLELDSRDTEHVRTKVSEAIERVKLWIENTEEAINDLELFNEEDFKKDLKDLYIKHNKPKQWAKLLEDNKYIV